MTHHTHTQNTGNKSKVDRRDYIELKAFSVQRRKQVIAHQTTRLRSKSVCNFIRQEINIQNS